MATFIARTNTELYSAVKEQCRKAMEDTKNDLLDELGRIIEKDVYGYKPANAETKKMRTKWLLKFYRQLFEVKIYNAFGQGLAMNIKPDLGEEVPSYPQKFQHGSMKNKNEVKSTILNMKSYLEMLNDPSFIAKAGNNPYHFPYQVDREPFWDDFVKWCNEHFIEIFQNNLSKYVTLRNVPYQGQRYLPK